MKILVPVDGSDCSFRALAFAAEMATNFDATLHVVHITDSHDEATEETIRRARDVLDAHDVEDDDTISVRWAGGDRGDEDEDHLDELAIYLAEYLGTYGEDPLEQPEHVQKANAVLWATEKQRWRPSNGAQEYMATNQSPPDPDWELVGIEDGEGEIHEVGENSGGVTKMKTMIPGQPPPDG